MDRNKKMKQKRKNQRRWKFRIFFLMSVIISTLCFAGIYRVSDIKNTHGEEYEKAAIQNQINKVQDTAINANRGTILDRNNQALALSSTVFNVALDIRLIDEINSKEKKITSNNNVLIKTIDTLSKILDIDKSILNGYFKKDANGKLLAKNDTNWKIIKKGIPYDTGKLLEKENLSGINLESDTKRVYPYSNLASQVIGFIRGDTSWGLESSYNDEMTGVPGRIYRTYDNKNYIVTTEIPPQKGNDIVTTLDLTIQQYSEQIVKDTYNKLSPEYTPEYVNLIVMNPNTAEILSMAQYPNFNLNNPEELSTLQTKISKDNFEKLSIKDKLEIQNKTWRNSAISDSFEPGSTFKADLVAAALDENVVSLSDTFFCEGYRMIGGYKIRCHKRSGHGKLTLTQAIAKSCNLAMIDVANLLGRVKFLDYQLDFGFGSNSGIDLYGEQDSSNLLLPVEKLNSTELATSAFGQTFSATSLQSIVAFSSLINGGNIMKPYLVSQIINEDGNIIKENSPKVVRKVISEETSNIMRKMMVHTFDIGSTGHKASIPGYNIGGKTGTAQQGVRSKNIYTLSFAAYFPAENPQYVAFAVIQKPKNYIKAPSESIFSASPMIKEIFQKIIDYKAISPSNITETLDVSSPDSIILKDYTNKSLKGVLDELNRNELDYQLIGGSGDTIVKQIPLPNIKFDKNGKILLYIENKGNKENLAVIPDVTNLSLDEAEILLKDLGFNMFTEIIDLKVKEDNIKDIDAKSKKIILEQLPQSGIFIEKGSTIKVKVKLS